MAAESNTSPRPITYHPSPDRAGTQSDGSPTGAGRAPQMRKRRGDTDIDDWTRQRKDNHVSHLPRVSLVHQLTLRTIQKEVERRRRGTINEGINELARIVPNSSGGEKAKGAVLSRAVGYIHQLKENEARNIEKWTLEKLLMDQAMGDLQSQLEDMRRRYEDERRRADDLRRELEEMRGEGGAGASEDAAQVGSKRPRVE